MDDIVGQNKLKNKIMMYETQVTLRADIIFEYLLEKTAVSISSYKRNVLFGLLYSKDNLADQVNKNNFKNSFEHVF